MYRILLACLFLLAASQPALAKAKKPRPPPKKAAPKHVISDDCNFETLTQSCQLLSSSSGDVIPFPDGTSLPNLASVLKVTESSNLANVLSEREKGIEKARRDSFAIQNDVASLLQEIDTSLMHPQFKAYFLGHYAKAIEALLDKTYTDKAAAMWPPQAPVGIQVFGAAEYRQKMLPLFTEEQQARLAELYARQEKIKTASFLFGSKEDVVEQSREITPERKQKVAKLTLYAWKSVIKLIVANRKDAAMSVAELNAVRKLNALRFTDPLSSKVKNHPLCRQAIPNAFYDQKDHSINLCASFYNMPDVTILSVVAHEIAHAVDPCNAQFGLFRLHMNPPGARAAAKEIRAAIVANNELTLLMTVMRSVASEPDNALTAAPLRSFVSDGALEAFQKVGFIEPIVSGAPFDEYVFKDVYSCLQTKEGGKFQAFDNAAIGKMAETVTGLRAQVRGKGYDPVKDRSRIVGMFNAHPECVRLGENSQMSEAVADWVGSRVVGEYLKGKQLKTRYDKLAPVGHLASFLCAERLRNAADEDYPAAAIGAALRDFRLAKDSHPPLKDRIDKIYLSAPGLRRAIGCRAPSAYVCEHHPKSTLRVSVR